MVEMFEILLVEDNPSDVELMELSLKSNNLAYSIQIARDGDEALKMLFGNGLNHPRKFSDGPRLIILDIKLPKVDGIEVLKRIKEHPITRTIPVVMLTSSTEEQDMMRSYALGANSYICKPVDFSRFKKIVKQMTSYWLAVNELPN